MKQRWVPTGNGFGYDYDGSLSLTFGLGFVYAFIGTCVMVAFTPNIFVWLLFLLPFVFLVFFWRNGIKKYKSHPYFPLTLSELTLIKRANQLSSENQAKVCITPITVQGFSMQTINELTREVDRLIVQERQTKRLMEKLNPAATMQLQYIKDAISDEEAYQGEIRKLLPKEDAPVLEPIPVRKRLSESLRRRLV